ncbi:coth protein-domain-containing protein [Cokeromyces recurvatus]|uniref:coth protein-domain-containing protein n=1 Tax=Cokeromyces recurvatus TaxID=90255 RepID=UPI002220E17F|nr:coth protein-domain-containing protein [Cokeromyces recurvatus]KAI7900821.1 coth protein-domain-containing protein [Cokeromyces recurvatus]
MKFAVGIISLTILSLQLIHAADVEYSVVAFPGDKQSVSVIVEGQKYPLSQSAESPNIFKGVAPSANEYQYALTGGSGDIIETALRKQQAGITTTGNEFFNRSQTVHDVPPLPQAYNPIHYSLVSNMNRSNEIATIILNVNATGFGDILKNPQAKHDYTNVFNMTYISNKEIYTFTNAGIKTSGQSSKDFAKQSYKIKLNEFATEGTKELLYGRTTFKLRAHETDPTFVREKLAIDCLAAAGAATVEGNFVRLYVNNEPYGLYLMIDDATKNFINNILRGGNLDYQYTGPTYKGNAMNEQLEGNLVYKDDLQESYNDTIYKLEDAGNMKKTLNKTNEKTPLIEFIKELNSIDPTKATDADNRGNIENLLDPQHTMIHMAINFLIGSWDGFWHQASNYYLTKETSSEKWTLISYDFDETFGLGAPRYMATTPYTNFSRPNSQRPLIDVFLKSPYYKGEFEKTLQTIVKRFFKPSVINPRLAAWKQMLQEDVEWDMSIEDKSEGIRPQWTIWNFANNMNTTDGESMGVSEWVQIRSLAVQEQLNFTDIDDVTPLEAYHNSNIWDPNNYEKEPL